MKTRYLLPLLVLFVALDLAYTGWENYQMPLDGDLARIVLPAPAARPVLSDPFGWAALTRHEVYLAPNRFFAHIAMVGYFKSVPFGLQRLLSPISSVYAAGALFSALVQALVLYVLGMYASGSARPGRRFWLVVALLVPLFQAASNHNQMGIIDNAVTYTFFYAFPLALLLLFYWPFYQAARGAVAFPAAVVAVFAAGAAGRGAELQRAHYSRGSGRAEWGHLPVLAGPAVAGYGWAAWDYLVACAVAGA